MSRILPLLPWFAASALAGGGPPPSTLEGVAHDAKGRALVEVAGGRMWTVLGLDAWPDGVSGQRVSVRGQAGDGTVLPEARQDVSGAWSQGVAPGTGPEPVIRDAVWTRLPPAGSPWTLEVQPSTGAPWSLARDAEGVHLTRPDGTVVGLAEGADASIWAEVGRVQAAAPPAAAVALRLKTSGAAGTGGAATADGPRSAALVAALQAAADHL